MINNKLKDKKCLPLDHWLNKMISWEGQPKHNENPTNGWVFDATVKDGDAQVTMEDQMVVTQSRKENQQQFGGSKEKTKCGGLLEDT